MDDEQYEEMEDSPRLPLSELPPFETKLNYGDPDVLIAARRPGTNDWWAVRDRDSEEQVRAALQEVVDAFRGDLGDPAFRNRPEETIEEEFHGKIQFVLSHAVRSGWYVKVPEKSIKHLDKMEGGGVAYVAYKDPNPDREDAAEHEAPDDDRVVPLFSAAPESVHKVICPECRADIDQISIMDPNVVASYYDRLVLQDGKISVVGDISRERNIDTSLKLHFECRQCGNSWEVPEWITKRIDWS